MGDWKSELARIKRIMRGRADGRDDKGSKAHFDPPKASLKGNDTKARREAGRHPSLPRARIVLKPRASGTTARTVRIETPRQKVYVESGSVVRTPGSVSESHDTVSPSRFQPRVEAGLKLTMPEWTHIGKKLQRPSHQEGSTPLQIRVGVDFGTAFTKVAIRVGSNIDSLTTIPVVWSEVTGDGSDPGRYLLPGFVYRSAGGEYCWRSDGELEIIGNLKLSILEMNDGDVCPAATLAYLALVIRFTRAFLYEHPDVNNLIGNRTLRWELNIGCPTEPHEKEDVRERMCRIARVAWRLAKEDELRHEIIEDAWRSRESAADVGLETEPGVVPEFVAQIAGYLKSNRRREGLHALIDVGAGTLDVATFNIVNPNDRDPRPTIPIFFSAVRPLGTHHLNHERHHQLGLEPIWDDAAPVEPAAEFARRRNVDVDRVREADSRFGEEVKRCIFGVIETTRTNRHGAPGPRDRFGQYRRGSVWQDGLPIFVTGGGANCEVYRRALEKVETELRISTRSDEFRFFESNAAHGYFLHGEAANRLSVALGLTEDSDDIARIVPHVEVRRNAPPPLPLQDRPDHMEIYGDD